ncbi:hypothetical protein EQO05_09870 [Methanosarcina sp. MSH10X1]|uniref:hypothetical protein n=1 Tax=Methanosarcina sp. MSH10X1 TaxID=2507075 RepID=UPI000FFCB400|nr:hypothetical protein [Methanosarcina sp. MSH10X1]RXA19414.1 hypothetical protein EQO05_09870 [Methanosarcina sp. MSH10X1]
MAAESVRIYSTTESKKESDFNPVFYPLQRAISQADFQALKIQYFPLKTTELSFLVAKSV